MLGAGTRRARGTVSHARNTLGCGWGLGAGRMGSKPFCLGISRLPRRKGIQVSCRKSRYLRGKKVGSGHSKSFQVIPGRGRGRSRGLEAGTGWCGRNRSWLVVELEGEGLVRRLSSRASVSRSGRHKAHWYVPVSVWRGRGPSLSRWGAQRGVFHAGGTACTKDSF